MITQKQEEYFDYYQYSNFFGNYPYYEKWAVVEDKRYTIFFSVTFPKHIGWRTIQDSDSDWFHWNDSYDDKLPTVCGISAIDQYLLELDQYLLTLLTE